jgi:hypothetical protein
MVSIDVHRTILPPSRSPFSQNNFGCMDLRARNPQFGLALCQFDGSAGIHQILDCRLPNVVWKVWIGAAP